MKKRADILTRSLFAIACLLWFAGLVMPPVLPEFTAGLLAGIATILSIPGLLYSGWRLGRHKSPFAGSESTG